MVDSYEVDYKHIQNCPICESFEWIYSDWEDRIGNYHFITCCRCGLQGPSNLDRDMQKAVDGSIVKWNLLTLLVKITEFKLDSFE